MSNSSDHRDGKVRYYDSLGGNQASRVIDPNGETSSVYVIESAGGDVEIKRTRGHYVGEFERSIRTGEWDADRGLLNIKSRTLASTDEVTLVVSPDLTLALKGAVTRAYNGGLSVQEARQFDNLRAYIANHSGDGVLDAKEQGIIIQRADNIAPEKGRK